MANRLKVFLQKLNFFFGRNPRLEIRNDWKRFVPKPYKAVVIISADFELAWASQYSKSSRTPLVKSIDKAKQERENIPRVIGLCEQFNIPITWLTVGHLFLESCTKVNGISHPDLPRLPHFENKWWKFDGKDWFDYDPGTDYKQDSLWYCPDLIKQILDSKVKHEIGCHTFSHIDCRDGVCTPGLFKAEIEASQKAADQFGIEKMESFVHPAHTIGNLETLKELGFTNYRTDNANILGYPSKHKTGLWEFSTTLEFDYLTGWSINAQVNRYIKLFKRAIHHKSVVYLWFHPSFNPIFVEQIMPIVFEWLDRHRDEIWIVNTGEYVRWLNKLNT